MGHREYITSSELNSGDVRVCEDVKGFDRKPIFLKFINFKSTVHQLEIHSP